MATLTLSIATLTSTLDVADANAQRVLESAFALFHQHEVIREIDPITGEETVTPIEYTPQEKLDWIVHVLIPRMLVDKARRYDETVAIREAREAAAANAATFE